MFFNHITPRFVNQVKSPLIPASQVKTVASMVIKNEPDNEIMEIGVDNILDSSDIPDVKDIDIEWYPLSENPMKGETVSEKIFDRKHLDSEETQVPIRTENTHYIKTENITQSNKNENMSSGNGNRGTGQGVVEIQCSIEHFDTLSSLETNKELVLNHPKDSNSIINPSSGKAKHSKKTDFTKFHTTVETSSWKEDKEKIKVIKAPLIPVEPHEYVSLAKDKHVCNYCQCACSSLKNIKRHIKLIHRAVTTMYQCPYCSFKSSRRSTLRLHIIRKHKDTKEIQWFQCHLCEKKFKSKSDMTRHNVTVHLTPDQILDRLELCPICGKEFKTEFSMRRHMSLVHDKMKRKSQECEYTTTRSQLLKHRINNTQKKQRYFCEKCAFASEFYTDFKLHKQCHETEAEMDDQDLKYRCGKCGYKTYKHNTLKVHKLIHLKPEEIQYLYCYHCPYKCPRKSQLRIHIIKHHSSCDETKHKYQLERHTKNHEKRYHCDKCDYKSCTNSKLKRHKLIHLIPEEIQYCYCYHCSYKYKHKSNLKSHISKHFRNEEVPFHCYICNFMTPKRETIIEHIKKHSKVQIKSEINEGN